MRAILVLCFSVCLLAPAFSQTREEIVRNDKKKVEAEGFWIYNDLPKAFAEAKRTGKPIIVVLRCLPCHECVKLDDELVDTHPVIRPLLEQFVCVRQVSTNGLDLNLFQYDTDQSFAVFFLNADQTIYGRFGTRSHRTDWLGDVSLKGLAKALEGALALHANHDAVKESLAGKRGAPMEVASPELYPSLKGKYTDTLNYQGDVVKSCIHCHQIGDAQREYYWHASKPIPEKVLWPYPHPKSLGLILDPHEKATVKEVVADSPAERAGFEAGDVIEQFQGQPMLSIADVQWVLHQVDPRGGRVPVVVRRGHAEKAFDLVLEDDWRKAGDLSWRVTTWGLRRIGAGGMSLVAPAAEEAEQLDLPEGDFALKVKGVGKYGAHAVAHNLGIREGDLLVEFDGHRDFPSEQALLTYVVTEKKPGDVVRLRIRRGDRERSYEMPIQR